MKKVLVIAPHPDDEVLGCGGTMLRHIDEGDEVTVCIVTHAEPPIYPVDSSLPIQKAARECHKWMGVKDSIFLDFPAVMLESVERYRINNALLDVIRTVNPECVYIPHYGDMQKDHLIVVEACMVALRPKNIHKPLSVFGYETMSETAWNIPNVQNEFIPNVFIDISKYLVKKLEALRYYDSQMKEYPDARSLEAVEALARYRGSLMHFEAAESFMLIRELR